MYRTKIEKISSKINDNSLLKHNTIKKAASLLKKGELVAFPTETVYGLGANAHNEQAVAKIFQAKGRPQDNPLIVHIHEDKQLSLVIAGFIPRLAEKVIKEFWPGPLTLVLPKNKDIPLIVTAGLKTVAVRMPSHPVARALIAVSNLPVAAPSANFSGYPSPTRATHVYQDLQGRIPLIIDGGSCQVGLESTVIDFSQKTPRILRPGGITREEIIAVLGCEVEYSQKINKQQVPAAPGMKYRHYSPRTPLKLLPAEKIKQLSDILNKEQAGNIALLLTAENVNRTAGIKNSNRIQIINMGSRNNLQEIARNLFANLRYLDRQNFNLIIVKIIKEKGLGQSIMNRLHKAAAGKL